MIFFYANVETVEKQTVFSGLMMECQLFFPTTMSIKVPSCVLIIFLLLNQISLKFLFL